MPFFRILTRACLCAGVLAAAASCKSKSSSGDLPPPRLPEPPEAVAELEAAQSFKPGDRLELLVEEDAGFNGVYQVREGGYVLLPKVGRIPVAGLTQSGAESRVREYLQREQLTRATVFVERQSGNGGGDAGGGGGRTGAGAQRISVYVTGGVTRPGMHMVPLGPGGRPPGVFETLLLTGGVSKFGDEGRVKILRLDASGVRRPQMINVKQIRDGEIADVPVGEGDIIQVAEKVFGF